MTARRDEGEGQSASPLRFWANLAPIRDNYEPHRDDRPGDESAGGLNPFAQLDAGPWLTWGAVVGGWTLIALLSASQSYLLFTDRGDVVSLGDVLSWAATEVVTWAALSPIILWLARRFRIERRSWRRATLAQIAFALAFALAEPAAQIAVGAAVFGTAPWRGGFVATYAFACVRKFHVNFLLYWMIVGLSHGVEYYRRYRDRELRASQLEARLVQSRLRALEMQLRPHFLFNTLNSISALIDEDPRAANRMVARVGELLRMTLESSGEQSSLAEELRFLKTYLEIERVRFEDRLSVAYDVAPDVLGASVPNMLLQPIVENAIKHGVSKLDANGVVEIRARRRGGRLAIDVRDNGPGVRAPEGAADERGVGLANTRARLGNLYESGYSLDLRNAPDGGAVVHVELPFTPYEKRARQDPDDRR